MTNMESLPIGRNHNQWITISLIGCQRKVSNEPGRIDESHLSTLSLSASLQHYISDKKSCLGHQCVHKFHFVRDYLQAHSYNEA